MPSWVVLRAQLFIELMRGYYFYENPHRGEKSNLGLSIASSRLGRASIENGRTWVKLIGMVHCSA